MRADIQALRAIAVSLVLVYHLWPHRLTGGFVGVDVFFVISGYLITSHLLGRPPAGVRDLLGFWSRRVRRLLPASLLVLAVTLVASRLVAPESAWEATAGQVKAAALYAVNWHLAGAKVDYLALNTDSAPVQHFWSLSVEEQFYLGWPVLILALFLIGRHRARLVVPAGLAVVTVGSLAYSIHETRVDPAAAYFVTPTRVWELGVGGLLAAWLSRRAFGRDTTSEAVPLPHSARVALALAGLAAIGGTAWAYTDKTTFPGWLAAFPVLGAAAVIAAAVPFRMFGWRPVRWLGDVSYSLYLWHWPLIALVPYVSGGRLGRLDKMMIVVVALLLSGLTKRFVEDRFRTERWGRPLVKPFAVAALGMALVVSAASAQTVEVHHRQTIEASAVKTALSNPGPCLGASAIANKCKLPVTRSGKLTPTPAQAVRATSDAWHPPKGVKTCLADQPSFAEHMCHFGDPHGKIRVALVGNSHAANWLPAMKRLASKYHWELSTDLSLGCALAYTLQVFPTKNASTSNSCLAWAHKATRDIIKAHYDLVVFSDHDWAPAVGAPAVGQRTPAYQKGHTAVLRAFAKAHVRTVVLHDTPYATVNIPQCLETHKQYMACSGPRGKWMQPDSLSRAAIALHSKTITRVDLTRYFCGKRSCFAAIGRVPVYFDGSHLTAVYSRTLAPYLAPKLQAALQK